MLSREGQVALTLRLLVRLGRRSEARAEFLRAADMTRKRCELLLARTRADG